MRRTFHFSLLFLIALLTLLTSVVIFASFNTNQDVAYAQEADVQTKDEFMAALANKTSVIRTDDIDFEETTVSLNYDVTIISSKQSSTLSRAYFKIVGPIVEPNSITVTFENITFDGKYTPPANYLTDTTLTFDDLFADRDDKICIDGSYGYYDLSLLNCNIYNYGSMVGPAIYVENEWRAYTKNVNISNCKFENNFSQTDTVHVSNDKLNVSITNSEWLHNTAYKGAGFSVAHCELSIDNVNVHDNNSYILDMDTANPQNCGGGVYIGGANGYMRNSVISNNSTIFGGGLGISPKFSGSGEFKIANTVIKNNSAQYGGAICAHSLSGQPIKFIGCEIYNNTASAEGSSLYVMNYAYWMKANNGGVVEFLFSTFANNTATDTSTFSFYRQDITKGEIGIVSLKGCFIVGNDQYSPKPNDFNYIANSAQAINDGVVTQEMLNNCSTNGLDPIEGSLADYEVPASVYSQWDSMFENATKSAQIGSLPTEDEPKETNTWIIPVAVCVPVGVIIIVVVIVLCVKKKKPTPVSQTQENTETNTEDERKARLATLTERELKVTELVIKLKKRQEIAAELFFSENTIKKDLTSIYQKLDVHDKSELIVKYKDLF